jgi:hypothetical protein
MAKPRTDVRAVTWLVLGLLIWVTTMIVAKRTLLSGPESAMTLRAAMVVVGIGGFVAWLAAMARFVAGLNEFSQRVQFLSIAIAFVATVLVAIAGDFLQAAGFLGHVDFQGIWMLMIVLWWLGMIATSIYYR